MKWNLYSECMARVLIIEDDEIVRDVLKMMLEMEGHEVMETPDGNVGIKLYHEKPSDLVIIDIFMPCKEGLETISELAESFRDVKIIAVSGGGHCQLDFLDSAKKLGASRTLRKPFTRKEMLKTVDEVLQVHHSSH